MKQYRLETEILWLLLFLSMVTMFVGMLFFDTQIRLDFSKAPLFTLAFTGLPLLLLIFHSAWTLTAKRGLLFILIALFFGFLTEFLGLRYGVVFGGMYTYPPGGAKLFDVPIIIMFFWAAFAYTGYAFVNACLYWLQLNKPHRAKGNWWMVPTLAVLDAYVILAIDLLMDPIQVKIGNWQWIGKGDYFGVPIGNFIGWYSVAFLICITFRAYEYLKPKQSTRISKAVYLIPLVGYFGMALAMMASAFSYSMPTLAAIGGSAMLVPVLINAVLFDHSYYFKHHRSSVTAVMGISSK